MYDVLMYVQVLNVSPEMSDSLFQVLSAVLWIGNLEFEDTDSEACQLTRSDRERVRKISLLLGMEEAQVIQVSTTRQITVKGNTTDIALKYHEVSTTIHCNAVDIQCTNITTSLYHAPINAMGADIIHF